MVRGPEEPSIQTRYRVADLPADIKSQVEQLQLDEDADGFVDLVELDKRPDVGADTAQALRAALIDPQAAVRSKETQGRIARAGNADDVKALTLDELKGASLAERVGLVKTLLTPMFVLDPEEIQIVNVLETTPVHQRRALVKALENEGLVADVNWYVDGIEDTQVKTFFARYRSVENLVNEFDTAHNAAREGTLYPGHSSSLVRRARHSARARAHSGSADTSETRIVGEIAQQIRDESVDSRLPRKSLIMLETFAHSAPPDERYAELEDAIDALYESGFSALQSGKLVVTQADNLIARATRVRELREQLGATDVPMSQRTEEILLTKVLEGLESGLAAGNRGTSVGRLTSFLEGR